MSVIEDSLLAEIRNFLQDVSQGEIDFDGMEQAKDLLEKLKGR